VHPRRRVRTNLLNQWLSTAKRRTRFGACDGGEAVASRLIADFVVAYHQCRRLSTDAFCDRPRLRLVTSGRTAWLRTRHNLSPSAHRHRRGGPDKSAAETSSLPRQPAEPSIGTKAKQPGGARVGHGQFPCLTSGSSCLEQRQSASDQDTPLVIFELNVIALEGSGGEPSGLSPSVLGISGQTIVGPSFKPVGAVLRPVSPLGLSRFS
jgi:hypothetical protein